MTVSVNTNVSALNAQRYLNKATDGLANSMSKLASGSRINSAKDDAAGLQISDRLGKQVSGMKVAMRNSNDGISMAQTAEGAMDQSYNILSRMRDLSLQSANASNSAADRKSTQSEITALKDELNRIAETTSFGGQKLLNGEFGTRALQVGSDSGESINMSLNSIRSDANGMGGSTYTGNKDHDKNWTIGKDNNKLEITLKHADTAQDKTLSFELNAGDDIQEVATYINGHADGAVSASVDQDGKLQVFASNETLSQYENGLSFGGTAQGTLGLGGQSLFTSTHTTSEVKASFEMKGLAAADADGALTNALTPDAANGLLKVSVGGTDFEMDVANTNANITGDGDAAITNLDELAKVMNADTTFNAAYSVAVNDDKTGLVFTSKGDTDISNATAATIGFDADKTVASDATKASFDMQIAGAAGGNLASALQPTGNEADATKGSLQLHIDGKDVAVSVGQDTLKADGTAVGTAGITTTAEMAYVLNNDTNFSNDYTAEATDDGIKVTKKSGAVTAGAEAISFDANQDLASTTKSSVDVTDLTNGTDNTLTATPALKPDTGETAVLGLHIDGNDIDIEISATTETSAGVALGTGTIDDTDKLAYVLNQDSDFNAAYTAAADSNGKLTITKNDGTSDIDATGMKFTFDADGATVTKSAADVEKAASGALTISAVTPADKDDAVSIGAITVANVVAESAGTAVKDPVSIGGTVDAADVVAHDAGGADVLTIEDVTVATGEKGSIAVTGITGAGSDAVNTALAGIELDEGSYTGADIAAKMNAALADAEISDISASYDATNGLQIKSGTYDVSAASVAVKNSATDTGTTYTADKSVPENNVTMTDAMKQQPIATSLTVEDIDVTSVGGAQTAVDILDSAMSYIDEQRSDLGTLQNRLGNTVSNLSNISQNVEASKSRIKDVDFATETSNMTKNQILQQASTSILAQAKQAPQLALSLLG